MSWGLKKISRINYFKLVLIGLVSFFTLVALFYAFQARNKNEISVEKVTAYVNKYFNEADASDRIKDEGFAYYINTQPRAYLDSKDESEITDGNGPLVIIKSSGKVYKFSSSPGDLKIYANNDEAGFEKALRSAQYPVEPIATIK
jgi:hypothetical protein